MPTSPTGTFYVGGRLGVTKIYSDMTLHTAYVLRDPVPPSTVQMPCPGPVPG
jgi:hypothetical protein